MAGDVIANLDDKSDVLEQMQRMVYEAIDILGGQGDLDDFGRLLNRSWELKRTISERISNDTINKILSKRLGQRRIGRQTVGRRSFRIHGVLYP